MRRFVCVIGICLCTLAPNIALKLQNEVSAPDAHFTFLDVTREALPKAISTWYKEGHIGRPTNWAGGPSFPDLNGDGFLDLFYNNHYKKDPVSQWDLGLSVTADDLSQGFSTPRGKRMFTNASERFTKVQSGFLRDVPYGVDTHGRAFLDIDGDGHMDVFQAVGCNHGTATTPVCDDTVMWGTMEDGKLMFDGARDAGRKAGIHCEFCRGRFTYFADINKDGLLDLFHMTDPREDDIIAIGHWNLNTRNRKFKKLEGMLEYTHTMALHDADGDGNAEEFVVQRFKCKGSSFKKDDPRETPAIRDICKSQPPGSTAIYKYDGNDMKLISPSYDTEGAEMLPILTPALSESSATGDFDGDGLADLAVLFGKKIVFFYSSHRQKGELPVIFSDGSCKNCHQESLDAYCTESKALRVTDFDLDGTQEIFVLCNNAAHHFLLRKIHPDEADTKFEWKVDTIAGDVLDATGGWATREDCREACDNDQGPKTGWMHNLCKACKTKTKIGAVRGVSAVDWNNDGFPDLALTTQFGYLRLLQNAGNDNRFLAIKLVGSESNVYGIGSTVKLHCKDTNNNATSVQLREINTASHGMDQFGDIDDRIVFGLGASLRPVKLVVRWPSHKESIVEDREHLMSRTNNMIEPLLVEETMQRSLRSMQP